MDKLNAKSMGCLVGGAAGDALGYPVEFIYSFAGIASRYGVEGITDYDLNFARREGGADKALVSDDTQMTLYTAEGLLYAVKNDYPIIPAITNAYLAWLGGQYGTKAETAFHLTLADIDEINQNRAPGTTCISALRSVMDGKEPMNNSKGCGGIMRIAPVGIYAAAHGWTAEQTARVAGDVAEITHLHPLSTLASACAADIIRRCLLTDDCATAEGFAAAVAASLECVERVYPEAVCLGEFKDLVDKALSLKDSELPDWLIIENELGGGWVAEETLAIAVFSVMRHIGNFRDCLVCAVNHGGDSDSTGAVAGNILGAILSMKAIPAEYINHLQLLDLITGYAEALTE